MSNIVIIGAGLAGLTCARRLREEGIDALVLEASDEVGGRIRTDFVNGFRLDRGFQVLLTAYPEAQRWLDYDALDLCEFEPGAEVWSGGHWHRIVDPRARWWELPLGLLARVGSLRDKMKTLRWAREASAIPMEAVWELPETTSYARLKEIGFSDVMIERFWRPWMTGVFLEGNLETSSHMLDFVFGMMARGRTAVPRKGMGEIPRQLADGLASGQVRLNTAVESVQPGEVRAQGGSVHLKPKHVVVAVDGQASIRLGMPEPADVHWRTSHTLYFYADKPPRGKRALLMLNGSRKSLINHVVVMSNVSADYAPVDKVLLAVCLRPGVKETRARLETEVRAQLKSWFGRDVEQWCWLAETVVPAALPARLPLVPERVKPVAPGLWRCGDYQMHPSIQGAMESGRKVAEAVLNTL